MLFRSPDCEPADFTVLTMPTRLAAIGDPNAHMDDAAGSLDRLLELADRDEAAGLGDAPWPPHFRKMEGESTRVAPSRAKSTTRKVVTKKTAAKPRSKMPLIVVANSPQKEKALAGLERWKANHPDAAKHLRSTTCSWIQCAGGHRRGRVSASTCATFRRRSGHCRKRPTLTTTRRACGVKRAGNAANGCRVQPWTLYRPIYTKMPMRA